MQLPPPLPPLHPTHPAATTTWHRINAVGDVPSARSFHAASFINNPGADGGGTLQVFGGVDTLVHRQTKGGVVDMQGFMQSCGTCCVCWSAAVVNVSVLLVPSVCSSLPPWILRGSSVDPPCKLGSRRMSMQGPVGDLLTRSAKLSVAIPAALYV